MPDELPQSTSAPDPGAGAAPVSDPAPVTNDAAVIAAGPYGDAQPDTQVTQQSASPPTGQPSAGFTTPADGAPVAPPVQQPWYAKLNEFGFTDVKDEADAQARVVQAIALQKRELAEYQARMQQMEPYARQFVELQRDPRWQQFNQQQVQPQQPQSKYPAWYQRPEYDESLLDQYRETVVDPATGKEVERWKANAPQDYVQAAEADARFLKKWSSDLITRPHEVLPQIMEHYVGPMLEQKFAEREQQMRTMSYVQEINQKNADWLYEQHPVTKQILTDAQGAPVMSQHGQQVYRYMERLPPGMDPQAKWDFAVGMLERDLYRATSTRQQTSQQAAQTNDALKLQHLQQGAMMPPALGAAAPASGNPPPVLNRQLTLGEKLMEAMQSQGLNTISPVA